MEKGTKFQIIDKSHPRYMEVYVIMFKQFDNVYCYGDNINDAVSKGRISPKQIKIIKGL
jgi:hypothetical protein